ncbi:MAG: hypothetical protein ACLTW9_26270 [Enterocloster sp.]
MVVTAFDAYIGSVMDRYITKLNTSLAEIGVKNPLQLMQSRGGDYQLFHVLEASGSYLAVRTGSRCNWRETDCPGNREEEYTYIGFGRNQ